MNNTERDFFSKNNMNITELSMNDNSRIVTTMEIDPIVARYAFETSEEDTEVSIADIIGYDYPGNKSDNIFYNFATFFDKDGDGYHSRSCGLLDIPEGELIPILEDSFILEPIVVRALYDNQYFIHTNGLHRYMVLRAHFLNEVKELDPDSEEYQRLSQKYMIPVKQRTVDLVKTYANFLVLINSKSKASLATDYDDNWKPTGNVVMEFSDGTKLTLNDEQLIDVVRDIIFTNVDANFLPAINRAQKIIPKFAEFIAQYIPELRLQVESLGGQVR